MRKLAEMLTGVLVRNGVIEKTEEDVYHYGFQITMANGVNLLIALCIGSFTGRLGEVALFYLLFLVIRRYSGGYHAESYGKCFCSFAICIVMMLIVSELLYMIKEYLSLFGGITFIIYGITMWWFTPCPNIHVAMVPDEQSQYKKLCRGILLITGCVYILLFRGKFLKEASVILVTIWEIVILFWLGRRSYS